MSKMLQLVTCVVEKTFWTLVVRDRACRPRSKSCPPEFFVDREIQRLIREEADREERAIEQKRAREEEVIQEVYAKTEEQEAMHEGCARADGQEAMREDGARADEQGAMQEECARERRGTAKQEELRRARRREKRRAIKERSARESAREQETFDFYCGVVAQEELETSKPAPVTTKRQRGRIAEIRRHREADCAKAYDIERRDDERPRADACITLVTGHGMYGIAYGSCATTNQLRNLLLDANGFSRSSDFVVRTADFKFVPPDQQLSACGVLPGMCVHLGPRKEQKIVCVGNE